MRRAFLISVFVGLLGRGARVRADLTLRAESREGRRCSRSCGAARAADRCPRRRDLKRVSDYLNTIKSVQGRFTQIAADGRSAQGTFYLRKPGRIRFEYDKPNPILIVADGSSVAVSNSQLKTTDRYPLINSPLRLLLSESIDLVDRSADHAMSRKKPAY